MTNEHGPDQPPLGDDDEEQDDGDEPQILPIDQIFPGMFPIAPPSRSDEQPLTDEEIADLRRKARKLWEQAKRGEWPSRYPNEEDNLDDENGDQNDNEE